MAMREEAEKYAGYEFCEWCPLANGAFEGVDRASVAPSLTNVGSRQCVFALECSRNPASQIELFINKALRIAGAENNNVNLW